jgi:leucine dehydrogenase
MNPFDSPFFDDHEQITFLTDPGAGLRAIVAIHSSAPFGIAGGGCRIVPYATADDALDDVLRLSRAMTFKLALARIPSGGAKCVVIADPRRDKTPELLAALGQGVERLRGRYIIAEDVGTTPRDMQIIGEHTQHVVGKRADTGAPTAFGVFVGIRESVQRQLGRDLSGVRVAVQGLGLVGRRLCELLEDAGADLVVSDIDADAVAEVTRRGRAKAIPADAIYDADVDVFAPCALGAILDDDTIARLRCRVVAGGANNQLAREEHAIALAKREILFAPDFVLNMGGVIGASVEGAERAEMEEAVSRVGVVLHEAFDRADAQGMTPYEAAVAMAKETVEKNRQLMM